MAIEANLERFVSVLNGNVETFKSKIQSEINEELIVDLMYFLKKDNIELLVGKIKENEGSNQPEDKKGNILNNLLQLEPISLPIIDCFIKSEYLDKEDFCERVDKTRKITSSILESLKGQKLKIRKFAEKESARSNAQKELQDVMREIEVQNAILEDLKKKKEKEKKLDKIKKEILKIEKELDIDNLKKLEEKLSNYKARKKDIDKIRGEISKSLEVLKNLPKDEA